MTETEARKPRPKPAAKAMTYQDLRKMAECASSYRGLPVWMVIDEKGWHVALQEPTAEEREGKTVIECMNPESSPRPMVTYAMIGAGSPDERVERPMVNLLDLENVGDRVGVPVVQADAVFWSESAVEKFVVPYYASVYGNLADREVSDILDVLDDIRKGVQAEGEDQAFGLAHMPKSEYVQVGGTEPTLAGHTMSVLVRRANGEHVAMPVSGYRAARKARKG